MPGAQLLKGRTDSPVDPQTEANHRIANSLAELSAILMRQFRVLETGPEMIPRELVADVMKDMAGRIAALGRLHRLLSGPTPSGEIELDALLGEVVEGFESTGVFGDRLHVSLNVKGCRIAAAQASMLMQLFAEIATNAVKHAHPSGLPVEFTITAAPTAQGGLQLDIADDGVGLPDGFDEERDAGYGLRVVRGLVESAGGHLVLKSDPLGLTFSIELPGGRR